MGKDRCAMTGLERRELILDSLKNSKIPVSGGMLAAKFNVSRQVIVQDIALIRAGGYDIISTNRGYILSMPSTFTRVFKLNHSDERMEEELNSIVDMGGRILNVFVEHRVYGRMEAALGISSRRNVEEFIGDIKSGKSSPLKNITSGYHFHTVEADSEEILDMIEKMLREKGFLVENVYP